MWGKKTVAVVIFEESDVSFDVVEDYDSTGYVDEVIIVGDKKGKTNNSKKILTRAKYLFQKNAGYANAIKEAINSTKADLIIVTEENGSFRGKDILKLLSYSGDFDVVLGSRTHLPLIHKGSGMTFSRRVFDDLFGKMISLVFASSPLTDVGCTLRLTNRKAWLRIKNVCSSIDDFFVCEWLIALASKKVKFIEIPVHFVASRRKSREHTFFDLLKRALKVIFYVFKFRFGFNV
ncbi:hypothetical protein A3A60_00925 [Candidatus Curtissbacteria bacterium RIFCSPLOWO2_01_FULL_42_26]|uniref:Glycosyltransferase 2-like domain-containing protein n=1 Tax=Candidatus Curtissbacteria bacterium RIFCSPLOWO2_01_FULL_42_26 TaxID=1797729 RepID=A0A1F5HXW0_9BACT|nr:MAG: hypothetical protein A3A60_00925 [Candidatus Curtissbacteria bacterium RIFCSPLOWO2_01_FULL_42_26]